ncbi:MAG: metallophosphoesterase family protein [Clostridia bacterium]|nr:metallophosphoesterase family protein [Clostridia bacterium]MBO7319495.1 metallophosphoesterase family protein [Clostridia bacterium]
MKNMKKTLALILSLIMLFSAVPSAFAVEVSDDWAEKWSDYETEIAPAVTMFPGSDESERYIAWYSDSPEGYVELTAFGETEIFEAESKASPDGGYRLWAVITGLALGEYTYTCHSGDFISESYSFTVRGSGGFTALYVSDIHMSIEDENKSSLIERSYTYNETLESAVGKTEDTLDIIISGGDLASEGLTDEYIALSSPDYMKTIPFAAAIGNHDRKSIGYKYYTALPNEADFTFKSYIGTDYWVRYGDALFLMFDSCNTSMREHYRFTKQATKANEDAKWIIATMHHDMFGGREDWLYTENALLRFLWTPLFDEYGIDLCLYGHSHYYSVSNVIYNNKTATDLAGTGGIVDPAGTVYLSSASVNNFAPLLTDEGTVPPIGENAAFTYLEGQEPIYTLLEFTEDSLGIKSYTVDTDKEIYSLSIEKSDKAGGHTFRNTNWLLKGFTCFVSRIVNIINNYDMYKRYKDQGYDVSLLEGLIGS